MTDQVMTEIPIIEQGWVVKEPSIEAPEPVREKGVLDASELRAWEWGTSIGIPPGLEVGTYITIKLDASGLEKAIDEARENLADRMVDFERAALIGRQAMAWNRGPSCRCALCAETSEMGRAMGREQRALALCTPGRSPISGRVPDNFGLTVTLE